jgi:predicted RNA-binding Zn-ribbon protein involved in translation (DUF1610 family)
MTDPGNCANCGAPLPPDQRAESRYCATCSVAYWRGAAAPEKPAPVEDDATRTEPASCANCGTPLQPGQPADSQYCAKCTAAWQRGPSARK